MLIHFSIAYDKETNCDSNNGKIRTLGPKGLLELLERELGFFDFYPSKHKRLQSFRSLLNKHEDQGFYQEAFNKDPFAVSETLLKYRDELILIGWKNTMSEQPYRLKQIAQIEELFRETENYVGESDRWCALLDAIESLKKLILPYQIIVEDSLSDLPFYLQSILSALPIKNSKLTNIPEGDSVLQQVILLLNDSKQKDALSFTSNDNSFKIVQFNNRLFMEDVCAHITNKEDLVVLNDACFFDMSLVSLGKAATGSYQSNANPPIIQHFNIISSLLEKTPRLESIITFLQLTDHPFPYKLRVQLLQSLKKEPGFANENWTKLLQEFLNDTNQDYSNYTAEDRKKLVHFFLTFNTTDEHPTKKCRGMLSYLVHWSKKRLQSGLEPILAEQFSKLNDLCKEVLDLITDDLSIDEIQQLFRHVYSSANYTNYIKQQSSVTRLDQLSSIAEKTDKHTFWIDCKANDIHQYPLGFLQETELEYLTLQNLEVHSISSFLKLQYQQEMRGLLNLNGTLNIFVVDGEEMHPILLKIKNLVPEELLEKVTTRIQSIKDVQEFEVIVRKEKYQHFNRITLPTPQNYMELDQLSSIKRREVESASSMERFIHYPFDWVIERIAKLRATPEFDMPDEFLHNGNIAHSVIEILLERQSNSGAHKFNIDTEEVIKNVLEQVIFNQGIHYLTPENKPKLSAFTDKLIRSIQSLQTFIKLNELTIIACEKNFGKENLCNMEEALGLVTGYIDLVLEDVDGNPVILDLKWTRSETKYKELIENNEAIQLALYAGALGARSTAKTGYYLLNQNKLITPVEFKGDTVTVINPNFSIQETLNKLKKTLVARNNELAEGKLEIGEAAQLSDLDIMNYDGIILPNNKSKKEKKANPYTGYDLFKGLIQ